MRDLQENPFYSVLKEYEYWVVLFRDRQVTIGSVIIMTKDMAARSLGAISPEAWSEYGTVCADVERWLTEAFGAEKFNYLALMMKDPEVHFHVIPRYSRPVVFEGKTYEDVDWPLKTSLDPMDIADKEKHAIEAKIRSVQR